MTAHTIVQGETSGEAFAPALRLIADQRRTERPAGRLLAELKGGCWIYGAGGYGSLIVDRLRSHGIMPTGFIDRRAGTVETSHAALPIVSPETINQAMAQDAVLLVAVHNFAADQLPVVRWARQVGFSNVIIPAELTDLLGDEAASYWMAGRDHMLDHLHAFDDVLGMLADQQSIETMKAIARFRVSGEIEHHPASTIDDQYFPAGLPLPKKLKIVDGGAYIGDALAAASRAGVKISEWYAFEPDPANFSALVRTVEDAGLEGAALFPCGLGNSVKQLRFMTGGADGSRLADSGDTVIQVVAIDDVLHGARPNFVKLDIEGAEAEALDGMARTLARCRPQIAMSIYHKPADLWELPLKVSQLLPGAKLYVRQHGYNGFDTVLYAIP